MILKRLRTTKLHGFLSLDLTFNDDLNLLVGINGSGKTSALNAIRWVLEKDFYSLVNEKFDRIIVNFFHEKKNFQLKALKEKGFLWVHLEQDGEKAFEPLFVNLKHTGYDHQHFRGMRPEQSEIPLWDFMESLPRVSTMSVNRTVLAQKGNESYIDETGRRRVRKNEETNSAIDRVKKITTQQYSNYRKKSIQYDSDLKNEIIISALLETGGNSQTNIVRESLSESQTKSLETKVISFLTSNVGNKEKVELQIKQFFDRIRSLSKEAETSEIVSEDFKNLVQAQYDRVLALATAFNVFENKKSKAFSALDNYLDIINTFFSDSGKVLFFEESTGLLTFKIGKDTTPRRGIHTLSSGEKQILILFTIFAFDLKKGTAFIVDEPEISLHPKWQRDFMKSLVKIKPKNSQLILATHSPEIVQDHKQFCIKVRNRV